MAARKKRRKPAARKPKIIEQQIRLPLPIIAALQEASAFSGLTVQQLCLACLSLAIVGSKR